jgi:hypothetical protein
MRNVGSKHIAMLEQLAGTDKGLGERGCPKAVQSGMLIAEMRNGTKGP